MEAPLLHHTPALSRSKPVSVALDPVALVVTECITVTSAMRKHTRWAHSSVSAILGGGGGAPSSKLDVLRPSPSSRPTSMNGRENNLSGPAARTASAEETGLASRWGLRGKKGQSWQDNPLLSAFARLRSDLKQCRDIHAVEAPAILHPFLQVIRSSSTSAPITSLALIAITKFFAYGIISQESPQLALAMQLLASAVTHCRFEASDSATEEIVLFRILKLMEGMITGVGGDVLGDESMCELMETGISMCCQVRLSELLRRSAEVSMVTMCQSIFQRLKELEPEPEPEPEPRLSRRQSSRAEEDIVRMEPTIDGTSLSSPKDIRTAENIPTDKVEDSKEKDTDSSTEQEDHGSTRNSRSLDQPLDKGGGLGGVVGASNSQIELSQAPPSGEDDQEIKPYSLVSIRELFRVLVGLLDPHDRQHNDTVRVMALRIVDVALEVAGPSIANHPSLASLAKDTLCRHLFQLVRSENVVILNESLRVAGTLLSTCRRVLKLQQELFLSYLVACLHPKVEIPQEPGIDSALYDGVPQAPRLVRQAASQTNSGRSTPVPIKDRQRLGLEGGSRKPDAREAMIESVGALVRIPSFMAELFVNYDCEIDRSDLCLDMVGLMSRNAFPDAATWSTTNVPPLCLDALLGYIHSLAERLEDTPETDGYPQLQLLREQRALKRIIIKGATQFNENPKAGLIFLASQGIIDNVENPHSVVNFLRGTTRVDKKVLGDWLSKKDNEHLLSAFMDTFDFSDLRVDEAVRQLLNSFRLPGEAPLIARIVNEFSDKYFQSSEWTEIADKDAVYVLTYAIIMLNTDQHNPNVKTQNRMSYNDFARNLRGCNGGKDFEPDYLEEIYDSIKTREIILPEEHDNRHSFDHAWKELLLKIQSTSDLTICDTNAFDADMFAATWRPLVATLSYVFMSATDDTVFARVVTGFDQCALIAAKYNLHEAIDQIVFSLSSISTLATETLPSTSLNTEVQAGEKSVMVSETAVRFGRDFKAQLATVVLFRVVVGNEAAIRKGWQYLARIMLNLFVNSLLGPSYTSIISTSDIPSIPLQSPSQVVDRGERASESGLFSAFTSYVTSFANDEPPEPSDQEIEYTLCTVDCISACSFETLLNNISRLPVDTLKAFVETLLLSLPEDATPRVIVVKANMPAPTAVRPNGQKSKSVGLAYDPSVVFILELATILAARDTSTMASFGKEVADALQNVVRDASHMHPVTLSRAVYYLLSFLRASHEHDLVRAPVVLHAISKFDSDLLRQSGSYIVRGLSLCLNGAAGLRTEMANSPDLWSILHTLHSISETAPSIFLLVQETIEAAPSTVTAGNFEAATSILDHFATAGSVGAAAEQRKDQAATRAKQTNKTTGSDEAVIHGVKAIQILYQMTSLVPQFVKNSQLDPQEAWNTYWSPPFRILSKHCLNPCRQIRTQALSSLQRVILSPSLASSSPEASQNQTLDFSRTAALFTDVLFPLIAQLLRQEIWQTDPGGMGESRLQAAVMCCKIFVRYLDVLFDTAVLASMASTPGLSSPSVSKADIGPILSNAQMPPQPPTSDQQNAAAGEHQKHPEASSPTAAATAKPDGIRLWSHVLQVLERLLKSSGGSVDGLDEAIPESLKNVVLVMSSDGYLVPPAGKGGAAATHADGDADGRTPQEKRLWKVTFVRLNRFLPGLMEGIFPGAGVETPPPTPSAAPAQPEKGADLEADTDTLDLDSAKGDAEKQFAHAAEMEAESKAGVEEVKANA